MRQFIAFLFLIFFSQQATAQFEPSKNSGSGSAIPNPFSKPKNPVEANPLPDYLKMRDTITPLAINKSKGIQFEPGTTNWYNNNKKIENKLNKKQQTTADNGQGFRSDQYLGDFKSNSKYVTIIYRDHEYPDGDRVKVLLNNLPVMNDILLTSEYRDFNIELTKGFNKIDFQALNQGTSGPNTAEFHVINDKGELIFSNKWNLTTGVKASIVIVKDE